MHTDDIPTIGEWYHRLPKWKQFFLGLRKIMLIFSLSHVAPVAFY